jgi:hypothetical protein
MAETAQWVIQGGAVAVFLLLFYALLHGDLRTKWELEGTTGVLKVSLDRANTQVDKLLPALQDLTRVVERQNDQIEDLLAELSAADKSPRGATP